MEIENDVEYREIDYEEICKHYWSIYFLISKTVSNIRWNDDLIMGKSEVSDEILDKYNKESMRMRGWLERGTWRLGDLEGMLEYKDEYYFFYFAMNALSSMRHRFEEYLEDTDLEFPDDVYTYTKYDDIVMDYYQPIRLGRGKKYHKLREEQDKYWHYYYELMHRKSNYEWVKNDIFDAYRELAWLKEFTFKGIDNKDYDYNLSNIHNSIGELIVECYRLRMKSGDSE